jgi:alpha-beta hydrolase superfamily lysophospholipase
LAEPVIATHTAGDGYRWKYRRYDPPAGDPPRARVVCVHGIQSHGGWYDHSCRRLAGAGFTVSFLDRRGAGLNEQDRGDAPGFRRLLDDVAEFLGPARDRQIHTFLVAISWGGKIAAALQRGHPGLVDGLALLCPGFCARVRPSLADRLGILWSYLASPRKLFPVPLDDPELFTASPEWQQFLRDDPLAVRRATARFLANSVRLDAYLRGVPKYVTVPVLLLLAGRDRIIDNARTRRFVASFPAADKTIIEYPEAHHTLEFEPPPHPYLDDLIGWLRRQALSRSATPAPSGRGGGPP